MASCVDCGLQKTQWTNCVFFCLAQARCFWWCFCFRSGLVALFLKKSEHGDSWCTDSSFISLLVKLSQCLNRLCLTVFSSLWSPCCLCTFSFPISSSQSTLHLICFDTALIEQRPLSVMTLCDYPLCGGCQWSYSGPLPSQQCSPLLWFQRPRETQNLYCMDGHLLKLKCKYSNILRYWFWTFISCKL